MPRPGEVCGRRSAWKQPRGVVKESTGTEYEMPFPTLFIYFAIGGEYAVGLEEGETIIQRKENHSLAVKTARKRVW